jgi:ribosomal RNA methyltransferase Nop2
MNGKKQNRQTTDLLKKRPTPPAPEDEDLAEFAAEELSNDPIDGAEFEDFDNNDFEQGNSDDDEPIADEFEDLGGEEDGEEAPEEVYPESQAPGKTGDLLDMEKRIQDADVEYLNGRSQEVLDRLNNSKTDKLASGERVRLLVELRKIYCKLFNYNDELMEYIMSLFSPAECYAFLEMMETSRPVTIRVNSLKTQKASLIKSLTERGVGLEPLDEVCKMAFKINQSKVPIGATPEYLSGHYMLQSAASMLPVRALAPQPGECVLDMAAAPGGKTTHIGQIMKNKGVIVANDFKKDRTRALFFNCQRMGLTNVLITNFDGRKFPNSLKKFDRVLLDAPCTGLGVISRDQSIKVKRSMLDIYRAAHLQKELLRKAIDLCRVGGYIVYSTCSFAVEENEGVVDYVLKKRHVKLVDTGLNIESKVYTKFKEARFNDRMKYCVRVFPHVHNLDGFFIAKLLKTKEGIRGVEEEDADKVPQGQGLEVDDESDSDEEGAGKRGRNRRQRGAKGSETGKEQTGGSRDHKNGSKKGKKDAPKGGEGSKQAAPTHQSAESGHKKKQKKEKGRKEIH